MQQIVITKFGGPEVLKLEERPDQQADSGIVVIRVKAAGVNFADILARKGLYPDAPPTPCVVGYEVAGEIMSVGAGVEGMQIGQPVVALTRFGGYADCVRVPQEQVFPKPAALSFEEAAAVPVAYLTAYQLIMVMGALRPEEAVLIHNAGGGVGLASLDLAKKIGAKTYGTASAHKHDFLRQRGLDFPIDYRNRDWRKELLALTEGRGVELVLDAFGGSHFRKSYKVLRSSGRLGMYGISSATQSRLAGGLRLLQNVVQMPLFSPVALMNRNRSVFGVNLGHMWHEREKVRHWLLEILQGVAQGWARPHVDKVFALSEAGEAHAYIEARRNTGKVLLRP